MCTGHCQYMACAPARHQATPQPMSTFSLGLHYSVKSYKLLIREKSLIIKVFIVILNNPAHVLSPEYRGYLKNLIGD